MIIISMIIVIVIDTIAVTVAVIDTTVTVTVIDDTPSSTHSPSSANTKNSPETRPLYRKRVSADCWVYIHIATDLIKLIKRTKRLGKKKKGRGEKTDARRCIKKKNKQTKNGDCRRVIVSRKKKLRERRKVEGINRGIDGVCVCEGKTSHCRSCD